MTAVLEQTDARFTDVFGVSRGSGRTHSDSILPRPGREGILDVLYAQLRYVPTWSRQRSVRCKYVVVCRRMGDNHLYISDMAKDRREALEAIEAVEDGMGYIENYVINLDEDERVCVHVVALAQTRRGLIRDFRSGGFSLVTLLARA